MCVCARVTETMRTSGPSNIPLCTTGAKGEAGVPSTGFPPMKYSAHTLPYATGRKAPSLKHVFVLNGLTRCPETCAQRLLPCRVSYRPQGVYWLLAHCFPHKVCVRAPGNVYKELS